MSMFRICLRTAIRYTWCLSQSVLCFIEERQCGVLFSLYVFMYTSKSTIDRRRMIDQRSSLFSKMFFSWFQWLSLTISICPIKLYLLFNDTSTHGCTFFLNIKRHKLLSRRRLVIKNLFIWVLVSMINTISIYIFFCLILAMNHKRFDLFENIINIVFYEHNV